MKQLKKAGHAGILFTCLLVAGSFIFSSYKSRHIADDFWKMLGITRQSGTDEIKNSFLNGYLSYYSARNAKNIALNDRASVAKGLLDYTKQYISSPEFKKQYDDMRKNAKPAEPEQKPLRSKEEIQKDEIAKTEKSIKETEKSMKELGGDMAKALQPVVDMLKQNLKDYKDPNNLYFQSIAAGEKYQQEDATKRYKEYMLRWEKDYPESVNSFIITKLQKMLDATKGIDYNAALVEKYGKKRFVDANYERKGTEWKQGFRAGKEVTEMSRTFAEKWIAELKSQQ